MPGFGVKSRLTASVLRQIGESYKVLIDLFPNTIPFRIEREQSVEKLEAAAKIHPDGLFQFAIGLIQFSAKEFEKSEEAFVLSSESKGIYPGLSAYALTYASSAAQLQDEQQAMLRAVKYANKE